MTAVSTLIRKVQNDPRYPRYLQALLDGGISMETAVRAAAVRIESEDKEVTRTTVDFNASCSPHRDARVYRAFGGMSR